MSRISALSLAALVASLFFGISPTAAQYVGYGNDRPYNQVGGGSTDTGQVQTVNACSIVLTWNMGPGRYSSVYQLRGDEQISVMGIPLLWTDLAPGWMVSINYSYEGAWEPYKVARNIVVQLAPLTGTITRTSASALEIACVEDGLPTRYQMKVSPKSALLNFNQYKLSNLPVGTPVVCMAIPGSNPIIAMSVQVQKLEATPAPPASTSQPSAFIPAGTINLPQMKKAGG